MDYKSDIENSLKSLKKKGYTRSEIEKELDYADKYLTQILSKGGNETVAKALKKLDKRWLQKATIRDDEFDHSDITLNDDPAYIEKNSKPLAMQALADLAASNREMAEAHKILSAAQADLVSMLKSNITADDHPKIDVTLEKRFSDILMKLAEIGTGKRWATIEEAVLELNKLVVSPG